MIASLLGQCRVPGMAAVMIVAALAQNGQPVSWSKSEQLEPAELAQIMKSSAAQPTIISVVFSVMYRQRHILHAQLAGPTSKPEGIEALRQLAQSMPRDGQIVIYCGCCPMEKCPNLSPAYRTLKELGFTQIRVLNLPTNFHTDWAEKGYPVE